MMLGHIKAVNNGLQVWSSSFYRQHASLLELLVRYTSILDVPRCILERAVRLPDI